MCRAAGVSPETEEANRIVDGYNAIHRVVAAHHATLVDLRAAGLAARHAGTDPTLSAPSATGLSPPPLHPRWS